MVGYVGPDTGRNAFHRLARVREGDRVKVVRRDGRAAWFTVDSVRRRATSFLPEVLPERSVRLERPGPRLISRRAPGRDRPGDVVVSAHLDRPAEEPREGTVGIGQGGSEKSR